ncbi:MAG: Wzz/FepE/Etk N-terminal domain-containing protein [Prevotella sp.]|nr:Wzz/FepE/Etk N-terminal domain-containing protein [Prevotella sp.]
MEKTKEIDLIAAVKTVLKERKLLAISIAAGIVAGLIIAFATPKVYSADVVLVPELSAGGMGLSNNLAEIASSFGINLGNTSKNIDAIYPEIYPEILTSNDFIMTLFTVPVRLKDDNLLRTYSDHLKKDTSIPFWQYPKMWLNELMKPKEQIAKGSGVADPFKISRLDEKMCKAISGNIGCLVDKKTSVITLSVTDQDPLVAAIMVDTLQQRLQNYITTYRTKKARLDFDYYNKLYYESKAKYQKAQSTYASFCDANQGVMLEKYIAKRDELENEMQTAFSLMNQMAVLMQSAKAKIQERTPAFTVIKSAKMPYQASGMSRKMIMIMFVFLGVIIDAAWVLFIRNLIKTTMV